MVCNTDQQIRLKCPISTKRRLGATLTKGRGDGCDPEQGRNAVLESIEFIREILANNTDMVFITAGMGGGTGTGAVPVIAKEARELGILTVAIVTLPFKDEGNDPFNRAVAGIRELQQYVDSLLLINNQKLYEIYPDLSVFDAFPKADDIVSTAAKSIAEIITVEGYINVDFADVRMVMKESGVALMGTGKATGENRALQAAELALNSPLLSDSDIAGARNILVNVSSGTKNALKMNELGEIMNYINKESGGKANFKRGVVLDPRLDDEIMVTIVATGFAMNAIPELCVHIPEETEQVSLKDVPKAPVQQADGKEVFEIVDLSTSSSGEPVVSNNEILGVREMNTNSGNVVEPVENIPQQTRIQYPKSALPRPTKDKDINYMEDVPAYERKNINLNLKTVSNSETEISRPRLEEDSEDGSFKLRPNNSFLDQIAD